MKTPNSPGDRLAALGNQMVEVHIWLLETLSELRTEFTADPDGSESPSRKLLTIVSRSAPLSTPTTGARTGPHSPPSRSSSQR